MKTDTINIIFKNAIPFSLFFFPWPCAAQIIPDNTLPVTSQVNSSGKIINIDGGTYIGQNLFHSFAEFSVPNGYVSSFNNEINTKNIITRVTGLNASSIDGSISAKGTANLFLINPNGIIFNNGASLDIGGSFFASTASSLLFDDGKILNIDKNNTSVLSVSIPIGFNLDENSSSIQILGSGHSLKTGNSIFEPVLRGTNSSGIKVRSGKSISLIGGDVYLKGGIVSSYGGQINIGAIESGTALISQNSLGWQIDYNNVSKFKDIYLSQKSLIDASGLGNGSVQLYADNINLKSGSVILNQNQGSKASGAININTKGTLEVSGLSTSTLLPTSIISESVGLGDSAEISINSKDLNLNQGGIISSRTFTDAKGGNISINATNSILANGYAEISPTNISAVLAESAGGGKSGNIEINTDSLTANDGGSIGSLVLSTGNGGDVTINANDIFLRGLAPSSLRTSIFANSANIGNAGNLFINSRNLVLQNGAVVSSSTGASGDAGSITINNSETINVDGEFYISSDPSKSLFFSTIFSAAVAETNFYKELFKLPDVATGNAGNVTINTKQLISQNGGRIAVSTAGSGSGGNLTVNALESIDIIGTSKIGRPSILSAQSVGGGNGGNIEINAPKITVKNGGSISASSDSSNGGSVTINKSISPSIVILDRGKITATTFGGNGGNILITSNAIAMRNQSFINGTAQLNGGNINIESDLLAGDKTSFITANSLGGLGGKIEINTKGLIFDPRNITATSDLGAAYEGSVKVNFSTSNFIPRPKLTPSLATRSVPIACSNGAKRARIITADALNMPDDRLEAFAKEFHIPMFMDAQGRKIPLIEVQGWIPNGDGTAKTYSVVTDPTTSEAFASGCGSANAKS
jgi:filamentous hemagglutinin family protein